MTNILGELARPRPNRGVMAWANQVTALNLSVVTLEEIHYGLAWRPNDRIASWFEKFFSEQCQVLPVTEEIARRAGDLRGRLRAKGETRSQADMLIAATALAHRLTLVTGNEGDFEDCGVVVLNPFV
ncbi:MAG TPA: type II toxin-antitoxin system VapC family toxin [Vicinamibacteria bacterium]|nr:type II toxin-antitoxin system VapC family toxin [Vicinamibacteria bacterium]